VHLTSIAKPYFGYLIVQADHDVVAAELLPPPYGSVVG
jgi:hypothetical protein